ncbi:MAG: CAP domain-containing protein, partial [Acidobacteriota bacterium]|nr:CAP domain-containing protein [Acidobacteriota bacterium]
MTRQFTPLLLLVLVVLTATGSAQQKQTKQSQPKATSTVQKTGPSISLASTPEQEIVDEINLARSNPLQYSRYVADFRRQYTGNQVRFSDGSVLVTNEGVAAVDEAIEFLRLAKPEAAFEVRAGLGMAARTHLEDLIKTGRTGHKGSDGSSAEDRFSRFGTWSDSVGENIVYHSRSARENVISLLIDDG